MPFNSKGEWIQENDSVADKVNTLTSSSSPYIAAARASGLAGANRRGLLNSSMAQGAAQGAAISAALPIASQDAQAVTQRNQAGQAQEYAVTNAATNQKYNATNLEKQAGYDMDRQKLATASADRNAALTAALQANQTYSGAFTDIANNKDIPAATRDAYIAHLGSIRSSGVDFVQQFYGINLNWGQNPNAAAVAPGTGEYGVVPTNKDGVQGGGGGYNPGFNV